MEKRSKLVDMFFFALIIFIVVILYGVAKDDFNKEKECNKIDMTSYEPSWNSERKCEHGYINCIRLSETGLKSERNVTCIKKEVE